MEYEINSRKKFDFGLKELWEYRELFYFFTWRDIKIKYKQTVLGFLWAILQPLFMTIIFTIFFGDSIEGKTKLSIPYPLFALSGMLIWGVFSNGITNSANSMVSNSNIIKKIYFPRLIIPISSILVALIDFFIALIIFVFALIYFKVSLNYSAILFFPLSLFITCFSAIGLGSFFASINVKYRDVRYIIPFFIQGLLFLTPVLYPTNMSSNLSLQIILKLNPMSGALELMRGSFNGYTIDNNTVLLSFFSSITFFLMGIMYFRKTESYFADIA